MSEDWLKEVSRPLRAAQVDSTVPNVARVWNYLVGGRDNFETDRQAARQLVAAAPVMAEVAPASRAFLRRAVTFLAAEAGIRQFLDIGTGMPTAGNTHEVAQVVDPSCRVVYVDNDPVVLSHARAGLRSSEAGATSYLDADAHDIRAVMAGASVTLDLAKPVGVIMIDILNFLEDAAEVLARLAAAVPAGSCLAIMQPSRDERLTVAARRWKPAGGDPGLPARPGDGRALARRTQARRPGHRRGAPVAAGSGGSGLPGGYAAPGCGGQKGLTHNVGRRQ